MGKSVKTLVVGTPVKCLTGPLPVSHRQKDTSGRKSTDNIGKAQSDQQSGNRLKQISADCDGAGIKNVFSGFFAFYAVKVSPGKSDKPKAEAVIGESLKSG